MPRPTSVSHSPVAHSRVATGDPDYQVGAGDILAIYRPGGGQPEVVPVRANGAIHLGGAGDVRVDGLTASQISGSLEGELGQTFKGCRVAVQECRSQVIHVFWSDAGGGSQAVPYRGKESIRDFLDRIGCRECQKGYRVRVVRADRELGQDPQIVAVQLDDQGRDRNPTGRAIHLKPNDYVYIERDIGKPGELTKMTETPWYQKPIKWLRGKVSREEKAAGKSEQPPVAK